MKEIAAAIVDAMKDCPYVQKDERMQGSAGNYRYATYENIVHNLREAMTKHGLSIRPVQMDLVSAEQYTTRSGTAMNMVRLRVTYELAHTSGESLAIQAFGEGADTGDKACNKAMTGAMKAALLETFLIERGEDDPDKVSSELMERQAQVEKRTKPPKQKSPEQLVKDLGDRFAGNNSERPEPEAVIPTYAEVLGRARAAIKKAKDANTLTIMRQRVEANQQFTDDDKMGLLADCDVRQEALAV